MVNQMYFVVNKVQKKIVVIEIKQKEMLHYLPYFLYIVHSNFTLSLNLGYLFVIVLLDLSVAFDTFNHNVVISHLDQWVDI